MAGPRPASRRPSRWRWRRRSCWCGASAATPIPSCRALFETPRFAAANGVGFLINLGGYGQLFLISLFLQQARGADALQTGIQMVPMLAIFSIGNLASGRIAARWNVSAALLGGLSIATVLSAASIVAMSPGMPYWCFALLATGANLGLGLVVPAATSLVMQVSGTAHANSGAAALNANRQSGTLVGVALMGTILHRAPDWNDSLPLAYAVIAASYLCAGLLARAISAVHAIVDATRGPLQPRRTATPRPAK